MVSTWVLVMNMLMTDKFHYVKLSKEKFHWVIEKDKDFADYDDYYYDYYHPRGGAQRVIGGCHH